MAAKNKPIRRPDPRRPGHLRRTRWASPGASSTVVEADKRPPRSAGTKVTDEGDGGVALVEFLTAEKFV